MLDLIASTLSIIIDENDNLKSNVLYDYINYKLNNYLYDNNIKITLNQKNYVINKAFEIYYKM